MQSVSIEPHPLSTALALRDLTDPADGYHAMQLLVEDAEIALRNAWRCRAFVHRWPSASSVLRKRTAALVPALLRQLSARPPDDVLLVCPGLIYPRKGSDRREAAGAHGLDLWRVRARRPLSVESMEGMIHAVMNALLPDHRYRLVATDQTYTLNTLRLDVLDGDRSVHVGSCGLVHPRVLQRNGLSSAEFSGLAMGLTLDRVLMLRKGIEDIRLLRSNEARVVSQMRDLSPYRERHVAHSAVDKLPTTMGSSCSSR